MKAFHSNWTAPYLINSSTYEMKDYEILMTILSALKWREKNGSIKMVTDKTGKEYYKKIGIEAIWDLGIECKLDGIYDLVNKEIFWAAGKVYALSMEDGPIAMIDTDFIVWKPLEELIKERDEKIQSLVNEIEQNKKTWQTEKKTLLLQLEEKKSSDDDKEEQKEVPSKKENSVRDVTEKKKRWHFFNKEEKRSKEPDRFIETYLAGDTFNEAQKEFLIKCLEEGDTVEEMKTYASASLTPAMMQRLRQVRKKRRGQ